MRQQLELYNNVKTDSEKRKPRLTLKAKRKAVDELLELVMSGWDPSEETWRLIDWLLFDIKELEAKKAPK